jgi:hypothetical protein
MKHGVPIILLCLFLSVMFIHCVFSRDMQVGVTAETDAVRYRIGDGIKVLIHADVPEGTSVLFPGDSLDVSPFTVLNRRIHPPEPMSGGVRETLELTISIYETGEFEIPGIEVSWESDDGTRESASTQPQYIVVESVLTQEQESPRNVKPPIHVEARNRYVIAVISGLVLALLLLYLAARLALVLLRHKQPHDSDTAREPPKPADQTALEALEELRKNHYLAKGEVKIYFISLTEILKTYIGRRFAFNAPEHTTGEIKADMRQLNIENSIQTDILHVLDLADMVKFARFLPTDEQCRQALTVTEKIILRTTETYDRQINAGEMKPEKAVAA